MGQSQRRNRHPDQAGCVVSISKRLDSLIAEFTKVSSEYVAACLTHTSCDGRGWDTPPYPGDFFNHLIMIRAAIGRALLDEVGIKDPPECDEIIAANSPPKPVKVPRPGFVYLAVNKRNGFYKIGWSSKPSFREKTLQAEEPEIEFVITAPGTKLMEAVLRQKYSSFRVRGEWFDLPEPDYCAVISFLEDHQ